MDETNVEFEYKNVPLPEKKFIDFYRMHYTVGEIKKTKEWDEVYQHYYAFSKHEEAIQIHETKDEVEAYGPEQQLQEIIKCANDFPYFCHQYVKIIHPIQGLIPFILYQYQRRVIEEYEANRFNILSKFRQGGLTTVSVLYALWRCLFKTDQQILVMSKTDREAIAAGEIVKRAMQNLPAWMQPQMGKHNDHERQFMDTGSTLWFYTPEAARGKAITLLIIDEAAFIADMHRHWKSMYPVISTGGGCCVVSTVNGLGNWYEEIYHEAEAGENPFNVIELDYWEHPDYNNPTWVKATRANLGEKGWLQEVMRSFLGSGETYFNSHIIDRLDRYTRDNEPKRILFSKWANRSSTRLNWEPGALWVFKEPQDGHDYMISADVAEGVGDEGDNSCFQVLDMATNEQVAEFYSDSVAPHMFAKIINEMGYYYNTALVAVENMGPGTAVLSDLQHDLAYENLYYENEKQNKPGIKVNRTNRVEHLECLQNRLINSTVRINSRRFVTELKTFIYNSSSKRAEAQKGKHDDAIMAMAIGLFVRDLQLRGIPVGAEAPEELTDVFKSQMYEEIRNEIRDGAPEDWISQDGNDPILMPNEEDMLPSISFNIKRKNDKLLREFGW